MILAGPIIGMASEVVIGVLAPIIGIWVRPLELAASTRDLS
jgi:hypothetical protein